LTAQLIALALGLLGAAVALLQKGKFTMSIYKIIVWHNDSINGTHQAVLCSAKTLGKVLRDYSSYLQRPERCRSFTSKNIIQLLHIDQGLIASFPASLRGAA
jgi:uncharacterized membrane protein YbaN (DUF454 family)